MNINHLLLWLANAVLTFFSPFVYCLHCYHCEDPLNDACNLSTLRHCPEDMDVCSLEATWFGYLYTEMTIVKTCKSSTLCPNGTTQNNTSSCVRTHKGLSCTMCCDTDGCNNGANGGIPRPPPKPPVPQTLVNRLIGQCKDDGEKCETVLTWSGSCNSVSSWAPIASPGPSCSKSTGQPMKPWTLDVYGITHLVCFLYTDVDSRLQVAKRCDAEKYIDNSLPHKYSKEVECNTQNDTDFCVTCCVGEQCYSQAICSKFNYFLLVVLVIFVSSVNHWRIQ